MHVRWKIVVRVLDENLPILIKNGLIKGDFHVFTFLMSLNDWRNNKSEMKKKECI